MKYFKTLVFCVITIMAFSSCKKDWSCTCTVSGSDIVLPIENTTKGTAKDACDQFEVTYKIADASASCNLD